MNDDELQDFAKRHIAHEIRMLSGLPKHIAAYTRSGAKSDHFVSNALYEDLLVHARLLDDFLSNRGDGRSVNANEYITNWDPQHSKPKWRVHANQRVAHLDRARSAPGVDGPFNVPPEDIRGELGDRLGAFYRGLASDRKTWFPAIPECFPQATSA